MLGSSIEEKASTIPETAPSPSSTAGSNQSIELPAMDTAEPAISSLECLNHLLQRFNQLTLSSIVLEAKLLLDKQRVSIVVRGFTGNTERFLQMLRLENIYLNILAMRQGNKTTSINLLLHFSLIHHTQAQLFKQLEAAFRHILTKERDVAALRLFDTKSGKHESRSGVNILQRDLKQSLVQADITTLEVNCLVQKVEKRSIHITNTGAVVVMPRGSASRAQVDIQARNENLVTQLKQLLDRLRKQFQHTVDFSIVANDSLATIHLKCPQKTAPHWQQVLNTWQLPGGRKRTSNVDHSVTFIIGPQLPIVANHAALASIETLHATISAWSSIIATNHNEMSSLTAMQNGQAVTVSLNTLAGTRKAIPKTHRPSAIPTRASSRRPKIGARRTSPRT